MKSRCRGGLGQSWPRLYPDRDTAIRSAKLFTAVRVQSRYGCRGMIERLQGSPGTTLLPRSVRGALDAMRANMEHDWSVTDLAAAAAVSARTLQRQFQVFLGKTPGIALRDIRFERARRELLQGQPGTKVTDVALRCGFAHCGRFSVEYRRRYGETPSQTLRRQAVFAGTVASMPAFFTSGRDRPTVALDPIEARWSTASSRAASPANWQPH